MSTAVLDGMTDNSAKDNTGDAINGSEVDANPNALAKVLDGTTATDLGGDGTVDILAMRVLDVGNAAGAVQTNLTVEWDPGDGGNMTDNSSGVGIDFKMPDDADAQETFASLDVLCVSDAAGAEQGEFSFRLQPASGTETEIATLTSALTTTGTVLTLMTAETTVVDGDVLGRIDFQAPLESSGTDAILVGASIWAEADDTFAAGLNDTDLVFAVAESETAAERMRLSYDGTAASLALVGATTMTLSDGSITDSSGAISFGDESLTTTGVITGATVEATGDTAASDNAAMGYTSSEGLILTGQGSSNDVTIKNDADADVITIATGTTNVDIVGDLTVGTVTADGDTSAGDNATMGYTASEGLILTGQGSTNDITIKNDADGDIMTVATGGTLVTFPGDVHIGSGTNDAAGLHILTAAASASATNAAADELVLEGSGDAGMTIKTGNTSNAGIFFADDGSALDGRLQYRQQTRSFHVYTAATENFSIASDGGITFNNLLAAAASTDVNINGSSELHSVTSSVEYKENVTDIDFDTSVIYNLKMRSWDWAPNSGSAGMHDFGIIAEEAAAVSSDLVIKRKAFKEVVVENEEGMVEEVKREPIGAEKPYSIRNAALTMAILAEVQKLNSRVETLEAEA